MTPESGSYTPFLCPGGLLICSAAADIGTMELTEENVETVLDEVRPYLMAGQLSEEIEILKLKSI